MIAAGITSGVSEQDFNSTCVPERFGAQAQVLYGTREVAIILMIHKEDQSCKDNMR